MGRNKALSHEERDQILLLKEQNYSIRRIAKYMGRSSNTVFRFLKDPGNYGLRQKNERSCRLTKTQKKAILEIAASSSLSVEAIVHELGLQANRGTVEWLLKKKAIIPMTIQEQRMTYAEHHKLWSKEWNSVIFNSQRTFFLDGQSERNQYLVRKLNGRFVTVWAAIGYGGRSTIHFLPNTFNATSYTVLLEKKVRQVAHDWAGGQYFLQQDNTPINTGKEVRSWIKTYGVNSLYLPQKSPDLNILEDVWNHISDVIYANDKKYSSINELEMVLQEVWNKLSQDFIQILYKSLPDRIAEVTAKSGEITSHSNDRKVADISQWCLV